MLFMCQKVDIKTMINLTNTMVAYIKETIQNLI